MSEALKEARQTVLFILVLCVLWLLTSGALRTNLVTRGLVEDLGVWVLLKDSISAAYAEDEADTFKDTKAGESIDEITLAPIPIQSGSEIAPKKKLTISPPWQPGATIPFKLVRLAGPDRVLAFQVVSDDARIDQASYLAVIPNGQVGVLTPP